MAKTALATKTDEVETRIIPKVDVRNVTVDMDGFKSRSIFVRLPEDAIADDLKEPGIWKGVQAVAAKALRKFDRLTIVAFDESWLAEAIVANADVVGATLTRPRIVDLPNRHENLFDDGTYRVVWNGGGFHVERKSDGRQMTSTAANAALAERDLANLYPKKA